MLVFVVSLRGVSGSLTAPPRLPAPVGCVFAATCTRSLVATKGPSPGREHSLHWQFSSAYPCFLDRFELIRLSCATTNDATRLPYQVERRLVALHPESLPSCEGREQGRAESGFGKVHGAHAGLGRGFDAGFWWCVVGLGRTRAWPGRGAVFEAHPSRADGFFHREARRSQAARVRRVSLSRPPQGRPAPDSGAIVLPASPATTSPSPPAHTDTP